MKRPLFPLQYENDIPLDYAEIGIDNGVKVRDEHTITDPDIRWFFESVKDLTLKESLRWILEQQDKFPASIVAIDFNLDDKERLLNVCQNSRIKLLIIKRPLNTFQNINLYLATCNKILSDGGYIWCNCQTSRLKQNKILSMYPVGLNWVIFFFHYLWHRVCPKIWLTKTLYFDITKGRNRTFSRVEILGRLYRAGFEVINETTNGQDFFVFAHQCQNPVDNDTPSGDPIIKLNRVGKNGDIIGVYKFRTMYSYSEYLQGYIYNHNSLQGGGKFANDYRINTWGKFLRSCWLDELPMVANIFKGQLKLVGVRPLSRQYFSLYTPEMQQLRIKTKPGLLPPFYYEDKMPETLEEIQASERRYIEAYLRHPLRTDWRYFWGILKNIIFKKARSA